MKYPPGSFSKNFAWHGTGLRRLHTAIKAGFHDTLAPVDRQTFRANCGLAGDIDLIPINFFLHNKEGHLSLDELVFQAIKRPHSMRFDRLGLFAFHLNRAGGGRDSRSSSEIESRPAMWANEFLREKLWSQGFWQASALSDASLDPFLADRMRAQPNVRTKCRNNYRHMFELCDYWPTSLPIVNSGAEQWIASALFIAWDRHILNGGADEKAALLALIESDELYKLLGVQKEYALKQADQLANLYTSVGRLDRLTPTAAIPPPVVEVPEEAGTEWIDQEESDEVVERRAIERMEQKRDRKKAAALKKHYNNTCIFCEVQLQVAEDRSYSEAAHIRPLGKPHDGPDKMSNMLVLCPNHHIQFDRGVLRLRKVGTNYRIKSKAVGDPLDGKTITLKNALDDDCVNWHYNWFGSNRT